MSYAWSSSAHLSVPPRGSTHSTGSKQITQLVCTLWQHILVSLLFFFSPRKFTPTPTNPRAVGPLPGGPDARHVSVAGGNWQSLRNRDSPYTRITTVSTPPTTPPATLDTHAPHAAALCLCLGLRLPRRGHAMAAAGRDPLSTPSSSE